MKRKAIIAAVSLGIMFPAFSQTKTGSQSFDEFRKGLLDDYSKFRKSVLEDYDKYLEGVWVNYKTFKTEDRLSEPKPSTEPVADPNAKPQNTSLPAPEKPKVRKPFGPKTESVTSPSAQPRPKNKVGTKSRTVLVPSQTTEMAPEPTTLPSSETWPDFASDPEPTPPSPQVASTPVPAPEIVPVPTSAPEPEIAPVPLPAPAPAPEVTPAPEPVTTPVITPALEPVPAPEVTPMPEPVPALEVTPMPEPVPAPEVTPEPEPLPELTPEPEPVVVESFDFVFPFFGLEVGINDGEYIQPMDGKLKINRDYAIQWRKFKSQDAKNLIPELNRIAEGYKLNDYLKFQLIDSYVDNRYRGADPSMRTSLKHYLLANMGYDIRLALDENLKPALFINFKQYVFGRLIVIGDDNNERYYIFRPDNGEVSITDKWQTCKFPKGVDLGQPMDLLMTELNLPAKMRDFNFSFGGIELHGQVNENIFPIVYRYPQMSMADYAQSVISPDLREDLIRQFKAQLSGLPKDEAIEKLLKFTQYAFHYETDGVTHGFEKPYFIEEILFFPASDCEDRAIFYTYMLWNVLGVENHLIGFPGHECASVRLTEPIDGTKYEYDGKTFFISDPTFKGATTGMCMDPYKTSQPTIDYIYQDYIYQE